MVSFECAPIPETVLDEFSAWFTLLSAGRLRPPEGVSPHSPEKQREKLPEERQGMQVDDDGDDNDKGELEGDSPGMETAPDLRVSIP